jgi:PTH1 family peptidyl-tRNA hydrolase
VSRILFVRERAMKLIVGLGNPGQKYARNRHNIGFLAVERLAERHAFGPWKAKFQGQIAEGQIGDVKVMLLKPQTYMNESGRSVQEAARFLKLEDRDVIVLYDELDLAPGKVRVKIGGGAAGHNGIRSITAHRSAEFVRVRIGIGHPGHKDLVHNWVLGDFAKADQAWREALLDAVADAAPHLARGDNERFMSEVARLTQAAEPEPARPKAKVDPSANAAAKVPHPAGERAGKRQSALAENLRKWTEARKRREPDGT